MIVPRLEQRAAAGFRSARLGSGALLARWCGLWIASLGSLLMALPAPALEPTLELLAFDWARGRYVSPVVCEVDGTPIAGGRYFELVMGDVRRGSGSLRLVFEDLDASEASRCFDDLGRGQKNIVGSLDLVFRGRSRPGMAVRDLRERLKRKGGFEYFVRGGDLELAPVGVSAPGAEAHSAKSYRGATVTVTRVKPATDDDRLLAGLKGKQRVVVEVSGASGPKLRIPAVRVGPDGQGGKSQRR